MRPYSNYEGVGTSKHNCLCILFIRLTTCFGHCGPSSGYKKMYNEEKNIQCKIIGCGTYSELSTRTHCHAIYPYLTNNIFD